MSSGTLFVDPMFPPSDVSLVLNKTADPSIEWKRPKDIYEDPKFGDLYLCTGLKLKN